VSASLRDLDPRVQSFVRTFLSALAHAGVKATLTSTRRDLNTQKRLYDCFVRVGCSDCSKRPGQPGCYPAAAPGSSTHAIGVAFDLHLDPPVYELAGQAWESAGFTWGGRFSDPIHFDFRPVGSA
jgi:hypothetical protein